MRRILYFTALFLSILVYSSVAEEVNLCKSCSLYNENELLASSENKYFTENKTDAENTNGIFVSQADNSTSIWLLFVKVFITSDKSSG